MIQREINGLAQDCSNSIADALELLKSCSQPFICYKINDKYMYIVSVYGMFHGSYCCHAVESPAAHLKIGYL